MGKRYSLPQLEIALSEAHDELSVERQKLLNLQVIELRCNLIKQVVI